MLGEWRWVGPWLERLLPPPGSQMRPSLGQEGGEERWSQVGLVSESPGIRALMDLSLWLPQSA